MMVPTVHLNGTGYHNLLEELETAHKRLSAAIDALGQVTVHGRDYYVQGPEAYRQARVEMDARITALITVQDDLQSMYEAIQRQVTNTY